MLPLLPTPFSDTDLRDRVAELLPVEAPPNPPVDVTEAIHADWLELWYQPKIEVRSLTLSGAEALVRMRHPTWGTVPPAYFIPDGDDPHFRALTEFVISRAIGDWRSFVIDHGHVEIAVNLPVTFFEAPDGDRESGLPDAQSSGVRRPDRRNQTAANSFIICRWRKKSPGSSAS